MTNQTIAYAVVLFSSIRQLYLVRDLRILVVRCCHDFQTRHIAHSFISFDAFLEVPPSSESTAMSPMFSVTKLTIR